MAQEARSEAAREVDLSRRRGRGGGESGCSLVAERMGVCGSLGVLTFRPLTRRKTEGSGQMSTNSTATEPELLEVEASYLQIWS